MVLANFDKLIKLVKWSTIILTIIGIILLVMALSRADARVAKVVYAYSGSGTVDVLVSKSPDFTETLKDGQQITGVEDTKHQGFVNIPNLIPGQTYYFAAVAWDKNGNRSLFSATKKITIPKFKPFILTAFPTISEDGQVITLTIKLGDQR